MADLYRAFCALNRRRIEHHPLQKRDIIEETEFLSYQDKSLYVIESLDSFWLAEEAKRIKRMAGK